MTPQQLKNSILQMAMQGKLVEQRPEEGTGEELYQQIQKEKQKLIKEGKIKRQKTLPEITEDEMPFEIPESWKWVRMGTVSEIARGGSPRPIKAYITNQISGINWIKISDSDIGGKYIFSTKEKIRPEGVSKSRYVHAGDFLLTNSMSYGRPYILKCNGCIHDGWLVISNYQSAFDTEFLYYLLSSSFVFQEFQNAVSGAVVKNLNSEKVTLTIVPLIPLSEQHRIVSKIEEIMPFIDRYAAAYDNLQSYNTRFPDDLKKSILQMAFQGKLVPQDPNDEPASVLLEKIAKEKQKLVKEGKIKKQKPLPPIKEEEIPFDIPDSWEWVRWGDLSYSIQYGYNAPAKSSGRIKMVRISDIQNGKVGWSSVPYCDIKEEDIPLYLLDEDDILFARTGGTVGKSFLVTNVPEDAIYAGYLIRTRFEKRLLSPQFLKLFMDSNLYWSQLHEGTIATAQPNCNGKTLSKMILPLPPIAEQKRIVAKLDESLPQIDGLK